MRLDKVLTQKAIDGVLGDAASSEVVNDMLATGALQQVGGGFVPSQYWMDQAELRRIHTVLAAPATVPIIDLHSGETVATAPRLSATEGRLFTGTRTREIRAADESGFYLDRSSHSQKGLAKLPSNRRKSHGLPRRLVWALAEINGENPEVWTYDQGVLNTWGGGQFNTLLKDVFASLGYARELTADSYRISGFQSLPIASPSEMADLVRTAAVERRIRPEAARAYRESTAYMKRLSARLHAEEAYRAIPVDACLGWLSECATIKDHSGH